MGVFDRVGQEHLFARRRAHAEAMPIVLLATVLKLPLPDDRDHHLLQRGRFVPPWAAVQLALQGDPEAEKEE